MTSNYFRQYIAGYTVANFWRYPIRRHVTKASAIELHVLWLNFWSPGFWKVWASTHVYTLSQVVDNEVPDTPESREMVRQFTQKRAERTKELEQINKLIENNQKLRNQMSNNDHKMQEQIAVSKSDRH